MIRRSGSAVIAAFFAVQTFGAVPSVSAQETQWELEAPSYSRTFWSTLGGGILGASALGGAGYLLGNAINEPGAGFVIGVSLGTWIGESIGASRGASGPGHTVTTRRVLFPSAIWNVGGQYVGWHLAIVGALSRQSSESNAWFTGAALAGFGISSLGTAWMAHAMAKSEWAGRLSSRVSLGLQPSQTGSTMLTARVRTPW